MTVLHGHGADRTTRILAATEKLVLRRGVKGLRIAEIAAHAHVGKGTIYLHWETKEDLLVELFARDFLAVADEYEDALIADPDLCRPERLCPRMLHSALDHPFVRALHTGDVDLLDVLADHPRSNELVDILGPASYITKVMPVWREHGLARTDWPLDEQAYALSALTNGFLVAAANTQPLPGAGYSSPDTVLAKTVTALLSAQQAKPADVRAIAAEGLRLLNDSRQALHSVMSTATARGRRP